jgi:isomerase DpgB
MTGLSNLTDAYLEINSAAAPSASLIAQISAVCDQVEDANKDVILLLRLGVAPAAAGGAGAAADVTAPGAARDEPWPHDGGIHLVNQWERILRRLERLPAVTLAVAEGSCSGLALEVLLTADYRLAGRDARLRLPVAAESTWPGMALYRLANQLGVGRVRRLALFGAQLSATEAVDLGLLDDAVDDVAASARAAVDRLAGARGKDTAIRRQLLFDATTTTFEEALGSHLAACDRALRLARGGSDAATSLPPL